MKRVFVILTLILASVFTMSQNLINHERYKVGGFYSINGVKFGATETEALDNINCILLDIKKCGCKEICVDELCYKFYRRSKGIYVDILDDCYEDNNYDYKKELKILKRLLRNEINRQGKNKKYL